MAESPPSSGAERRELTRQLACFPAHIETDGGPRTALIRDVTVKGASILTRARLEEGQSIKLLLYIGTNLDKPREATGKVVRFEVRAAELPVWPFSAGIQFDDALTDCEPDILALAEKQRRASTASNK